MVKWKKGGLWKFFFKCCQYIDSNIPAYIFYETILSEIVRIARSTLLLDDFIPRLGALIKRMLKQGADMWKMIHQCKKAMENNQPQDFRI